MCNYIVWGPARGGGGGGNEIPVYNIPDFVVLKYHWHNTKLQSVNLYSRAESVQSVFTWRHGGDIGVPKQWNGGHVGVPRQSCGNCILFLCKRFSFVPINLHRGWPREWKRSISGLKIGKTTFTYRPAEKVIHTRLYNCLWHSAKKYQMWAVEFK